MKAIVTGATGFIGYALCKELLQHDYEVIAVIRPDSKRNEKIYSLYRDNVAYQSRLQIAEFTLENIPKLELVPNMHADVFYHLAWNGSSGNEREDFEMQYSNIRYTAEAIRIASALGCEKFIGAGSQAEYGVVHGLAVENAVVPHPFMMYGAAKEAAYQMGKLVATQENIGFAWPRIYSVYGVGENPGTLVNYVMECLQQGVVPELSSCDNMWNFMYITDCVRALRLIGENAQLEDVIHVASKDTRLLREYVEEIRDVVAPDMELGFGRKESNPKRTFWMEPVVKKLDAVGFACKVTFDSGIRKKVVK